ncbi:PREDICTED: ribonuclease P protein subunit p14-like isoform X3 [Priapulus caudatus]|uniref:Ribonuclease P protein subunit p14-like isoform X3 n=1 Tax=Priapulus caudatus TaxID=37621 RepID=A0ABM1F4S4_PRICU|nr:PREDICTED: ribonuclease P protein subunit p14-like isoform X3 [Priapulus caudatus]
MLYAKRRYHGVPTCVSRYHLPMICPHTFSLVTCGSYCQWQQREIGGAMVAVDVLKYNEGDRSAILRVHSHNLVKLWSALTLTDRYMSRKCAFRVHQVSPYLMGLAVNSREYEHT